MRSAEGTGGKADWSLIWCEPWRRARRLMPARAKLESGTCWNRYTPACGWLTVFSSAPGNLPEYGSLVPESRDALGPLISPHSLHPFGTSTAIHLRRTCQSPRPLLNQADVNRSARWVVFRLNRQSR